MASRLRSSSAELPAASTAQRMAGLGAGWPVPRPRRSERSAFSKETFAETIPELLALATKRGTFGSKTDPSAQGARSLAVWSRLERTDHAPHIALAARTSSALLT